MQDEKFYDQVVHELKADGPREGLWLKALTEANGDEKRAKIQYVKWRVAELAQQHKEQGERANAERERQRLDEINRRVNSPEAIEDRRRVSLRRSKLAMTAALIILIIGVTMLIFGETDPAGVFLSLGVTVGAVAAIVLVSSRKH